MFSRFNMKTVAIWLVIIMVCSFFIAGIIFRSTNGSWFLDFDNFSWSDNSDHSGSFTKDFDENKTFTLDGIDKISADTISTSINIIPVDTPEIKVHYYGHYSGNTELKFVAETSAGNLNLKEEYSKRNNINTYKSDLKLDIYVPKAFTKSLNINTVSGSLKVQDMNIEDFNFNSVSGELEANTLYTKNSSITSVSGDLNISGFKGDVTVKTTSGEITLNYAEFDNNININTVSGNTSLKLTDNAQFHIKYTTISGDIDSRYPITIQGKASSKGIEGYVGSEKNNIIVNSISGSLEINK
ncbi:MAG: DUF4097 family beta strand repeat-containing protein [Bacillota bacterium]|nr:DUF4097 family beta strand repeat-containing protein [Bacillota bacterium]